MTTETKTENKSTPETSDNKTVFGPLGKYAMVAVIMVTIIVTTAIMLDRQLKTVDEQIAAIEEEVADMHTADETNIAELAADAPATATDVAIKEVEVIEKVATSEAAIPESVAVVVEIVETPVAETTIAQQVTAAAETAQSNPATARFEMTAAKDSAQAHQAKMTQKNQARIEAYKLEQKQHMTEMFARINALESQQLGRYKANQDSQIVRLREQIAQQQQMIEALVLRNKELFELRAASMQRNQSNREQTLNRI